MMKFPTATLRTLWISIFIFAVLFFLVGQVIENWQQIQEQEIEFRGIPLLFSFIVWIVGYVGFAYAWTHALKLIGTKEGYGFFRCLRVYMISEFGKYIPGKIPMVVGRVYLGSVFGISKRELAASTLIDAILGIVSLLIVGTMCLFLATGHEFGSIMLASALLIGLGLAALHPQIFYPILSKLLSMVGRAEYIPHHRLSYGAMVDVTKRYIAAAGILGLSFPLFVASIMNVEVNQYPLFAASFCIAAGLGIAAIFFPSGLGVREGVMILILQTIMPIPMAALVSLSARIWMTSAEILLLGLSFVMSSLWDQARFGEKTS